jgi:hypothetical protein
MHASKRTKNSVLEQGDQTLCMSIAAIDNIAEPHNLSWNLELGINDFVHWEHAKLENSETVRGSPFPTTSSRLCFSIVLHLRKHNVARASFGSMDGEGESDCRVEVSSRNVSRGVDRHHHCAAKSKCHRKRADGCPGVPGAGWDGWVHERE